MTSKQKSRRIPVTEQPLNAETPLWALAEPLTPPDLVYVRNHFEMPTIEAAGWTLAIDGAVARPTALSLDQLKELPVRTVSMVLECAGNARNALEPQPPGTPWGLGAVSRLRFRGTPLVHLLERVGPTEAAREAFFVGADSGEVEPGRREVYARSLPLEVAEEEDVLLAWEMNGEPLPKPHGFPLRLVVPGWYGMASVKWLTSITLLKEPFEGFFQDERYVYSTPGDEGVEPVDRILPRALILSPGAGERLPAGEVELRGVAWSGFGPVARVQISADGGSSWIEAELSPPEEDYTMTAWQATVAVTASGAHRLRVRAEDETGRRQPPQPRWNEFGYGNNQPHTVEVLID